MNKLSLI